MSPSIGRRSLLTHLGTAVAGAAAGAGAGVALAPASDAATGPTPPGRTISPWGRHQPGITQPTPPVAELVALTLRPEALRDPDALGRLLRVWTTDVEALTAGRGAPGDTTPWLASAHSDLTITVGLGRRALRGRARPAGFEPVPAMRHDRLLPAWCGGDLLVQVMGREGTTVAHAVRRMVADAGPWATLAWRQSGSWNGTGPDGRPVTGRNHFGQVDGSANPPAGSELFDRTVWITEGPWAGGTTLVVRRIEMDLTTWDELTGDEQEASTGRRLADGTPLTGGAELDDVDLLATDETGQRRIALDAHVRRSHPSVNAGARIHRRGLNYVHVDGTEVTSGLVFLSHQRDLAGQFTPIQQTLDDSDALNEWTTAIGSAEFALLPGFTQGTWLGHQIFS